MCAKRAPERCDQHEGGGDDETPYQTLTRFGSLQVIVRSEDADEFRSLLRRDARADRLRIRTYVARAGDLAWVIAELADYTLSEEEQSERFRRAMEGFDWGVSPDP